MNAHEISQAVFGAGLSAANAVAAASVLLLLLALRWLLPPEQRRALVTPAILLCAHVLLVVVARILLAGTPGRHFLALTALLLLLASAGRGLVLLALHSRLVVRFARVPKIFGDIIQGLVYAAAALITLNVAGVEPGSLLTTSALLTAVIGLSLQDTLGNLFAGLAIQAQRPFDVGDWIQFDERPENIGEVLEINWRAATVRTIENAEITVPNGLLARTAIRNLSRPTRPVRRNAEVVGPYAIPPRRVQELLLDAIRDVPGVLSQPRPTVVTKDFTERGVLYQIRFFIEDIGLRDVIGGHVRDRAWYALQRAEIGIPPPLRHVAVHEVSAETLEGRRVGHLEERRRSVGCVDLFRELPDDARQQLAELSSRRVYTVGERILRQGEPGEEMYVIESGEVQIVLERPDDPPTEIAQMGPGQFFGEMSLMTGARRSATAIAVRESVLLVVDKSAFQAVLSTHPNVVETVSSALSRRSEHLDAVAALSDSIRPPGSEVREGVLVSKIRKFFSL